MRTISWSLLVFVLAGVTLAAGQRHVTATANTPVLAFASKIEMDPQLGITLRIVAPTDMKIAAEVVESLGARTALHLVSDGGSGAMVARLSLSTRFTSGHVHFTVQRGDVIEHQFRQFAIRPSAHVGTSAIQSQDGRVTLYVQSDRLAPDTSVIVADVGAVGPPLPAGTAPVVGPFAISTTKPGRTDGSLGATLHVAMPRALTDKPHVSVLRLDEANRKWTPLDSRVDQLGAVQVAVDTFGVFVVVQP